MLYHSTNDTTRRVPLKEAILRSLPPDNGLYMPDVLPVLGDDFWQNWRSLTFQEIGFAVARAFFGDDVPSDALLDIVYGTLAFDAPLVTLAPDDHVLELFHGPTLAFNLTSANSINLARLVPQTFYYIHAARQLAAGLTPVFVVPSGNFGNLTAGLLAMKLGLPVSHFVAATNHNDVVPEYLRTGNYIPRPGLPTISNAMDVGAPSNFARMTDLFGGSWEEMKKRIAGIGEPRSEGAIQLLDRSPRSSRLASRQDMACSTPWCVHHHT